MSTIHEDSSSEEVHDDIVNDSPQPKLRNKRDDIWDIVASMSRANDYSRILSAVKPSGRYTNEKRVMSTSLTKDIFETELYSKFKLICSKLRVSAPPAVKFTDPKVPTKTADVIKFKNDIFHLKNAIADCETNANIYSHVNRYLTVIIEQFMFADSPKDRVCVPRVLMCFRSLYDINVKYGTLMAPEVSQCISHLIDMVNGIDAWKEAGMADAFVSFAVFQPLRFVTDRFVDLKNNNLHPHQQEFLNKVDEGVAFICLDWDTGSGKTIIVPAIAKANYGTVVVHVVQELAVLPAASVAYGAAQPVAIIQSGVMKASPSCDLVEVPATKTSAAYRYFSNRPTVIVMDYTSLSNGSFDPLISQTLEKANKVVVVFDDLPSKSVSQVALRLSRGKPILDVPVATVVFMTATLRHVVQAKLPETLVLSHSVIYGFIELHSKEGVISPLVEDIDKFTGWRRRLLSPAAFQATRPHLTPGYPLVRIEDLSYDGFVDYFKRVVKTHLASTPTWNSLYCLNDLFTAPPAIINEGRGVLVATDSASELTNHWETALAGGNNGFIQCIVAEQANQKAVKRKIRRGSITEPADLFITMKRVKLSRFNNAYSYDESDGSIATYDEKTMATWHRLSRLSSLDPTAPMSSYNTLYEVQCGKVPFVSLLSDHCNGHNIDSSCLYLPNLQETDALVQSVGRLGRMHHQFAGILFCESREVFSRLM